MDTAHLGTMTSAATKATPAGPASQAASGILARRLCQLSDSRRSLCWNPQARRAPDGPCDVLIPEPFEVRRVGQRRRALLSGRLHEPATAGSWHVRTRSH